MKYVHRGSIIWRGDHSVKLAQVSYIFDCPHCEYIMTALSSENITTIRDTHIRICHVEELVPMRLDDAFDKFAIMFPRISAKGSGYVPTFIGSGRTL